ncbi:MAG: RnfABCDGE type electron transport complex subunit D [Candidatus Sumerlaeota bacterium]
MTEEKTPPESSEKKSRKEAPKGKAKVKAKAKDVEPPSFVLSSSPHLRTRESIESAMYMVVLALVPALIGGIVFFGFDAIRVTLWCIAGTLAFEFISLKARGVQAFRPTLFDGSAIVTGLLLALNLPSGAPWWLCVAGAFVAMVIAKHVFGGLGSNPFNPALVARIFLLIAWPAQMTRWPIPNFAPEGVGASPDAVTAATPLSVLGTDGLADMQEKYSTLNVLIGNVGGCIGETSAILLLLGGLFLIWRGVIRWHIPLAYILSFGLLSAVFWLINPDRFADPIFHIAAGGLMIGAFFMATDYTTSPLSAKGMLVFGVGCGVLTFVIRYFGSFPEGVSFSIVIMNAFTPLIDRKFVPKRFGIETTSAQAA